MALVNITLIKLSLIWFNFQYLLKVVQENLTLLQEIIQPFNKGDNNSLITLFRIILKFKIYLLKNFL